MNKRNEPATFEIQPEIEGNMRVVVAQKKLTLGAAKSTRMPLFVMVPVADHRRGFLNARASHHERTKTKLSPRWSWGRTDDRLDIAGHDHWCDVQRSLRGDVRSACFGVCEQPRAQRTGVFRRRVFRHAHCLLCSNGGDRRRVWSVDRAMARTHVTALDINDLCGLYPSLAGVRAFAGPRLFSIRRPASPRSGANLPQKGAWASGMWVAIQRESAPIRSLGLGAITPYIPCGVSWTALLLAATLGHPAASIGFMALFALASALPIAFVAYAAGGMLGWRPSVGKKRLFGALLIAVAGAMIAAPLVAKPSPTCPCHQNKAGS